jgi:hypothetical protein
MSTTTEAVERSHHPYSPSTLAYLEVCPLYKSRPSKHARTIAGTIAHKVVETAIDNPELSDEDAAHTAECLDFAEQRRQKMQADFPQGPIKELREVYLPVDDLEFPDAEGTTAGFVDLVLVAATETYIEMLDWKFGFWQVEEADTNPQGIAYILGLFRMFPKAETIRAFFKQPPIGYLTEAVFTRSQIPELYLRVQAIVAQARKARMSGNYDMAKPHVPVCNFCDHLGDCPRGLEFALRVGKKFHPVEFPESLMPGDFLSKEGAARGLSLVSVLKVWCDAFRRQLMDRIMLGKQDLPDTHVIQSKEGSREIVDQKKFDEIALKYVSQQTLDASKTATFGVIEKAISDAAPRGQKENTVNEFKQELEKSGAVERGEGYAFLRAKNSKKN